MTREQLRFWRHGRIRLAQVDVFGLASQIAPAPDAEPGLDESGLLKLVMPEGSRSSDGRSRSIETLRPLVIDDTADGLFLLAWAVRMIEAGGFVVEGWDPETVRVVRDGRAGSPPIGVLEADAEAAAEAAAVNGGSIDDTADGGPTGQVCANCGSADMRPSGTCSVCANCGTSGGCS